MKTCIADKCEELAIAWIGIEQTEWTPWRRVWFCPNHLQEVLAEQAKQRRRESLGKTIP